MTLRDHNSTFPHEGDLPDFIMDYVEDLYQPEEHIQRYEFKAFCGEGGLSLWELFDSGFQQMCKTDDIESLEYILREAPTYKVDLEYSNYTHLDTIIRNNCHNVLMYFAGKDLIPLDNLFQEVFANKNYPKNIATSIIETCIFNKNLETNLISTNEISQKRKL